MRIKTLLCLAALTAGVATSMAQSNVYSLNIVGYVSYTQTKGTFQIMANPLNQTNNDVQYVFPNGAAYPGLQVFKRNSGGGYDTAGYDPDLGAWNAALTVPPGTGVWLATPNTITYSNTFVGEVILNSTNPLPAGYSIKSSVIPQAGKIQTDLLAPSVPGDQVFIWNGGGYDPYSYDPDLVAWTPSEPNINVAQGFWYYNSAATKNWVRNFSVGP